MTMADRDHLELASPPPTISTPRGRMVDSKAIVKRFFVDSDGREFVTSRWVRDNMPYKISLSHSRVVWYDQDVEQILAEARRLGIQVKDVKLKHLEQVA